MRSQADADRPNVVFRVLSQAALDHLDQAADRAGLTRSQFIRQAIADAMAAQAGGDSAGLREGHAVTPTSPGDGRPARVGTGPSPTTVDRRERPEQHEQEPR